MPLIAVSAAAEPGPAMRSWREADSVQTRRALAKADAGLCERGHPLCRHFYLQGRFAKAALARSPEAKPACEAMFAAEGGVIAPALGAKACAALLRREIPKACALLRGGVKESPDFTLKTCEDDFRMFLGEDGACLKMPEDAQGLCRGIAALRRIKTADGAQGCRREPYCRALQGETP